MCSLALKAVVAREAVTASVVSACAALRYAYRQGARTEGLLAGLTLAMAIIPEEFAVVRAVMLSLGAWRLAKAAVLTRQAQAIETLGTTTVLCVDKTGTLTKGAPEAVLDLCEMAPAERIQRSADAERLSAQGLRVLGVARAHPELVARAPRRRRGTTGPRGTMTGLLRGAPIF